MEKVRRTAALYFFLQGILVIAWWAMLITVPESLEWFQLEANSKISLFAFWLPDAVLIAMASLAAGYLVSSRNRFETAAMWLLTGAVSYAAHAVERNAAEGRIELPMVRESPSCSLMVMIES